ncbi:MAG TPA: S8 family serine peptidase [Micromonosporaceae bacterium]
MYPPHPSSPPGPLPPARSAAPVGAVVATVLVGVWIVAVTVPVAGAAWLIDQVLLISGIDRPAWLWLAPALLNATLIGLPAVLLAVVPRSPAVRTTGRVWALGAAALAVLGVLRLVPILRHERYLLGLALLAGLAAALIRRSVAAGRGGAEALRFAIAGGGLLLLPWLWLGTLGGLTETLLAGLAAAALGWLAAELLAPLWPAYGGSRPRLVLLGGLVAGVGLLPIGAVSGLPGTHLAAMLVLAPVGVAAAALQPVQPTTPPGRAATGWLVGPAVAGPLAFADPEEISLLLAVPRDVPFWVAAATGAAVAIALLLGLGYGLGFTRRIPRRGGAAVLTLVLIAAGAVYVGLGQPGLHGERLFVVLKQQADLTGVPPGSGPEARDARVREVYRRLVETAERTQADLRRDLDRWGLDYTPYYLVNAIEVEGGPAVRAWLARRPDVDRVLLSQRLRPLPAAAPPARGDSPTPTSPPWNLTMIRADLVWTRLGVTGSGIVVGSSDSGADGGHPALADNFRGGDDSWYDPWNGTRAPTDTGGHGTHTLGSAVGGRNIGVAPGAEWVACVNLDRNLGNPARYLDCLQFMLAPFPAGGDPFADGRPERAPHVLTNSWSCPQIEGCDAAVLRPATAALAAAGVFVVAAAGNTGPSCASVSDPPAPYADVFTVGAVDRQRRVTRFSSRGPAPGGGTKPDLVAPGAGILSAMPGGGYAAQDGTSMATPQVAGVVALMWSANPTLIGDVAGTRRILLASTVPARPSYASSDERCGEDRNILGAGLIDAYAAVRAAAGRG